MLWTIIVILLVLWLLGLIGNIGGGLIWLLLVTAAGGALFGKRWFAAQGWCLCHFEPVEVGAGGA